jgi:3-hydroxyacyl-CoA dehydrogenase
VDVRTVAVIGAGAIGTSWAAFFAERGFRVVVHDPAPDAAEGFRAGFARMTGRSAGVEWVGDLAEAAREADLVVENGPERLDAKREIFAGLDEAAAPHVPLASSSSGLPPSSFQEACLHHPERVLVAHPFNPPHLMPLVEIVGGRATDPGVLDGVSDFLASLGKRPVRVRRELPGHIANRLQAALWREAYALVQSGAATVADVDAAIAWGPGLRWALLGPFLTQHLSGGVGGIAHVLEHLGPPMEEWWQDLGDPTLSTDLVDAVVGGVADEFGDRNQDRLLAERDALLRELIEAKLARRL